MNTEIPNTGARPGDVDLPPGLLFAVNDHCQLLNFAKDMAVMLQKYSDDFDKLSVMFEEKIDPNDGIHTLLSEWKTYIDEKCNDN